jgi:hypothetical protein
MADIAQKDRPERLIFNCASRGDAEIQRRGAEIPNFVKWDWALWVWPYEYGLSRPRGEYFLAHQFGRPGYEYDYKVWAQLLRRSGIRGILRRSVQYKPDELGHFAFGELAWNPDMSIEDLAATYVKRTLRTSDALTGELLAHWIKLNGYRRVLRELERWRQEGRAYAAKAIDAEYPGMLASETRAVKDLLPQAKGRNIIVDAIAAAAAAGGAA